MSNNSRLIGALLVGAAAGAILGVLFAPEKGVDTRKRISEGANGLADDLKDRMSAGRSLIDDLIARVVSTGEEYVERAKSEAGYASSKAKEAVNQL